MKYSSFAYGRSCGTASRSRSPQGSSERRCFGPRFVVETATGASWSISPKARQGRHQGARKSRSLETATRTVARPSRDAGQRHAYEVGKVGAGANGCRRERPGPTGPSRGGSKEVGTEKGYQVTASR
jgi:hypothetical protein